MTIVPIGKLVLQEAETENREEYLRELISELHEATKAVIQRCIEAELEREVTQGLQRKAHGRSKRVNSALRGAAVCRKCGCQQVSHFGATATTRVGWTRAGGMCGSPCRKCAVAVAGVWRCPGEPCAKGSASGRIWRGRCRRSMAGV